MCDHGNQEIVGVSLNNSYTVSKCPDCGKIRIGGGTWHTPEKFADFGTRKPISKEFKKIITDGLFKGRW